MKVAIPRMGETVAPCFGHSVNICIFTVRRRRVVDQVDFTLQSHDVLDRVRLLRDQGVDVLICGGVQQQLEDMLAVHDIQVISWVAGQVDELLEQFIRGELVAGTARLGVLEAPAASDRPAAPSCAVERKGRKER